MARKKLNKKVALLTLITFAIIVLIIIGFIFFKERDPAKFMMDAQAAIKQKDFKTAKIAYDNAYKYTKKSIDAKIDILFAMADLALIEDPGDASQEREPKEANWTRARGCWKKIVSIDTSNLKAYDKILDFYYTIAKNGSLKAWNQVEQTADKMLKIYEKKNIEPSAKVLLAKGKASLEKAKAGSTTDIDAALASARKYLNMAKKLDPENMQIYMDLITTEITQGQVDDKAGKINAIANSIKKATEIAQEAIDLYPDNPEAYINMLSLKKISLQDNKEDITTLAPEFTALDKKFPNNAKVCYACAGFFQLDMNTLDKAAEYAIRSIELDPTNIDYYKIASSILYRHGMIDKKPEAIDTAIEISQKALTLPDAQDTTGPNQQRNKSNKLIFNSMLAKYYIEKATQEPDKAKKDALIAKAQDSVHAIEQIIGVAENRMVLKWKGLLDYAKGNKDKAITELYNAYQKYQSTDNHDADLSYTLAQIYKGTNYLGAREKFLESALQGGIVQQGHPEAALELAGIFEKLSYYNNAIQLVESYEKIFGKSETSSTILIRSYLSINSFDEASSRLDFFKDGSSIKDELTVELLLSQVKQYRQLQAQQGENQDYKSKVDSNFNKVYSLLEKLIKDDSAIVEPSYVAAVSNYFMNSDKLNKARELVDLYVSKNPKDIYMLSLAQRLKLKDPKNVSIEKIREINRNVLSNIADPKLKAIRLAQFYKSMDEYDKALELLKPLLDDSDYKDTAITNIFDIALLKEDFDLALEMKEKAKKLNLDNCEGNFFAAKLAIAKQNYKEAIQRCQECLKMQPIFPAAYATISRAYDAMKKENLAIDNIDTAFEQNPTDATIARQRAILYYKRNKELGKNVTAAQNTELERALTLAIRLNPTDSNLTNIYAEYTYTTDPRRALAIRQSVQKNNPTAENALLLANMAVRLAKEQSVAKNQEAMLKIARQSYEEALRLAPNDSNVLNAYSEFLRLTGEEDKAEAMLAGKDDILWKAYLRSSKYDKANALLKKLYKKDPSNVELVKGLTLVAQRTANKENVIKYTNKLIELEDTVDNRLAQAQAFLELGLLDDAVKSIKQITSLYPNDERVQLLEASLFIRKGQLEDARKAIDKLLTKNQTDAVALRLRAQVNNLSGKYEAALRDLVKATSLSDDPELFIELAKTYARTGNIQQAITELKVAIDEDKVPLSALSLLEKFYIDADNKNNLSKFYDNMISKYPESNYWRNRKAAFLASNGKLDAASKLYLDNWNKSKHTDLVALQSYLGTLYELKDYSKLISFASEYTNSKFSPMIYSAMAQAKAALGDTQAAKEYFNKALDNSGLNRRSITLSLALATESLGSDAVKDIISERLLAKSSKSLKENMCAYIFFNDQKQYNKALSYIDTCIGLTKDNATKKMLISSKADTLQLAYYKMPDKKYLNEAIALYSKLLSESPNDIAVLNNLSYMLASNNTQLDKAISYAQEAYALAPGNGTILDTYAFALLQNNEPQKALELLLQAVQLFELSEISAPADVYIHLGKANEMLNKPKEALAAYELALKANIPSESVKKEINDAIERLSK